MIVHQITGPKGSGKSAKLRSLERALKEKRIKHLVLSGNCTARGVLQHAERSKNDIFLIDDGTPALVKQLQALKHELTVYVAVETKELQMPRS